jgi:thiol reductant ABC exporter CydD subunit
VKPLEPRLLRLAPGGTVVTAALSAVRAVLAVTQAVLLADLLADGFRGASVSLLWWGCVLLLRAAAGAAQELVSRRAAAGAKKELRGALLCHLSALGPSWLSGRRSGELATLLGTGLDALDGYFVLYLPQLLLSVLVPSGVLLALAWYDWRSAVIVAVTLPLLPVFLALVGMHTKQQTAHQWRELSRLGGHFLDVLSGLPTLRVFGRAQAQVAVLRRITDQHRVATVRTLRTAFLSALVLELVASLAVAVLAVSIGFRTLQGELDLRTALTVLLLAPEAFLPLRAVGAAFHAAMGGVVAAQAAFDLLDLPVPAPQQLRRPPTRGALVLEAVTVRRDGRIALDAFDLTVASGEQVVLEGPSGSGKSTALGLLLGLVIPTRGRVLVDGQDLRDLDLEAWRTNLSWVPQLPHLFACTIADNIRLGRPAASDREVREAARAAHAEDFVDALPAGFATVLGEGGRGLSVGQQRRIAVARAFLRDAPVLILDEPTAGLDDESEVAVAESVHRLSQGRTVVLATHRLEIVTAAHRVVRLGVGAAV